MAIELQILAWTLVLALVHIFAAAVAKARQYGAEWSAGPRDEEMPPLKPFAGRLVRAQINLFETLPLFAAAVMIVVMAGRTSIDTALGVQLYFWSRVLFLPVYVLGIPYLRSVVFSVSLLGLGLVLLACLAG